jgi:hypothetical protein
MVSTTHQELKRKPVALEMVAKKLLKNIQEMDSMEQEKNQKALEVRKLKRNVEAWLLAPTTNDCHGEAGCAASLPHRLRGVEILSMWVPAVW